MREWSGHLINALLAFHFTGGTFGRGQGQDGPVHIDDNYDNNDGSVTQIGRSCLLKRAVKKIPASGLESSYHPFMECWLFTSTLSSTTNLRTVTSSPIDAASLRFSCNSFLASMVCKDSQHELGWEPKLVVQEVQGHSQQCRCSWARLGGGSGATLMRF